MTGSYPDVGAAMTRPEFDAMVTTLATWINDRGQRLVELDERSGVASPSDRTDVNLAFVLWQAIAERRDALVAVDWRDHGRPNPDVAGLVWSVLADRTGSPLASNLPEAVALVDELSRRVTAALDHSDTSNVANHEIRVAIEADLGVAERLANELGEQVRAAADLRGELSRLTSAQVGAAGTPAGGTELDDAALDRLRASASSLRVDLEATGRERTATLAACTGAHATLSGLRSLEAEAHAAVAACADRFTDPPRLAVPSVDAVELPPDDLTDQPWPRARPVAESFTRTVGRVEQALRHVIEVNTAARRRRDDLRGLLQAYRDKADSFGAAERPEIDDAYQLARNELWSAPCDLARAEVLTADYQQRVQAVIAPTAPTAPADVETP